MAESGKGMTGGQNLEKWQIALAVGATFGVAGLAVWYFRGSKPKVSSSKDDKAEKGESSVAKAADATPAAAEAKPKGAFETAQSAKNKGNKYFKAGKYDKAIECYTEAIEGCPALHGTEIATFYQNRAAAYEQLKNYSKVIADCSHALEHNKKYTKALFRRAKAAEILGELEQSLQDVTAVCILESFTNQNSLFMADRVLKELGKAKANEAYKLRKPLDPSQQFIHTYFSAFANDPIQHAQEELMNTEHSTDTPAIASDDDNEKHQEEMPEKERIEAMEKTDEKQSPYKQALRSLRNKDYPSIIQQCSMEINLSTSVHLAEALLLRATFYLLRGEGNKAIEDLDRILERQDTDKRIRSNAMIKRGSMLLQQGHQEEALADFARAEKEDPENSDIYHNRGQLNLLIDKIDDAVKDFEKSVKLNPNFAITHVQKCYTEYRLGFTNRSPMQVQHAIKAFEDTIAKFPDCSEGYALYGQALCDQQLFDKADENFQKALELEPGNANIYVHRGLLQLQWQQNIEESARLINKALETDRKCEFAYETLGTIEIQRGNLDQAIDLFNHAISLAKTEVEMAHLYSLLDAAVAQAKVAENLGITIPSMAGT